MEIHVGFFKLMILFLFFFKLMNRIVSFSVRSGPWLEDQSKQTVQIAEITDK